MNETISIHPSVLFVFCSTKPLVPLTKYLCRTFGILGLLTVFPEYRPVEYDFRLCDPITVVFVLISFFLLSSVVFTYKSAIKPSTKREIVGERPKSKISL